MSFKVKVTVDGESETMSLEQFLEENSGAREICSAVEHMLPGEEVKASGIAIYRPLAVARGAKRIAKFKVDWNFDRTRSASVLINRDTGMVEVRPHRRHKSHFMALADLAQIICTRSIAAEIRQKKKERKLRRMKGKAA